MAIEVHTIKTIIQISSNFKTLRPIDDIIKIYGCKLQVYFTGVGRKSAETIPRMFPYFAMSLNYDCKMLKYLNIALDLIDILCL